MYILHITNKNYSSWSLRAWVLMRTLGIPFEEKLHRLPYDTPSFPEFRKFSPTGLVPVLDDGDWKCWESLGIVGYLADRHAGIWPTDQRARDWARSATAEMHAGFTTLRGSCGMNVGIRTRRPTITAALQRDLDRLDELWADGIARFGGPFLAGKEFSAADAFFCPVAFRIQSYDLPLPPRAAAYVARLLALPAMAEWTAAALAEDFREVGHERDTTQANALLADHRVPMKR
jgi:glutathione S-transferase